MSVSEIIIASKIGPRGCGEMLLKRGGRELREEAEGVWSGPGGEASVKVMLRAKESETLKFVIG